MRKSCLRLYELLDTTPFHAIFAPAKSPRCASSTCVSLNDRRPSQSPAALRNEAGHFGDGSNGGKLSMPLRNPGRAVVAVRKGGHERRSDAIVQARYAAARFAGSA
jgi:hypothetical protein